MGPREHHKGGGGVREAHCSEPRDTRWGLITGAGQARSGIGHAGVGAPHQHFAGRAAEKIDGGCSSNLEVSVRGAGVDRWGVTDLFLPGLSLRQKQDRKRATPPEFGCSIAAVLTHLHCIGGGDLRAPRTLDLAKNSLMVAEGHSFEGGVRQPSLAVPT